MKRLIVCAIHLFFSVTCFGQDSLSFDKTGIYTGFNFGTWFPDQNNKVLGHPPMIGFTADIKPSKNAFGLNFDLIGWPKGTTTEPIEVKFGDSVLIRNEYFGTQITLDYFRELLESKRFVFEVMTAIGYGDLSYYNPDKDTNIHKASLVFSPGISIRCILGKKFYVQLKTQYSIANYDLKDDISTDLKGNYFITKLIIGGLRN